MGAEETAAHIEDEDETLNWLEEGMFFTPCPDKLDDLPSGWRYKWRWMAAGGDQIEVLTVITPSGRHFDY